MISSKAGKAKKRPSYISSFEKLLSGVEHSGAPSNIVNLIQSFFIPWSDTIAHSGASMPVEHAM